MLPGISRLARNPLVKSVARDLPPPVGVVVGFILTVLDNILNQKEDPSQAIFRAALTTGFAFVGGALGALACVPAVAAGIISTVGTGPLGPIAAGAVCVLGVVVGTAIGSAVGDWLGNRIYNPPPPESSYGPMPTPGNGNAF
jgi:membrane protein DedA with SNARE-associated domain